MSGAPISSQGALDRLNSTEALVAAAFNAAILGERAGMVSMFEHARREVDLLFNALDSEAVVVGNQPILKNLMMLRDVLGVASGAADCGAVLALRKIYDSRLNLAKYDLRLCEIHHLPRRPLQKAPRPAA